MIERFQLIVCLFLGILLGGASSAFGQSAAGGALQEGMTGSMAPPAVLPAPPPLPAISEVMMLRLRQGEILWGAIAEHDPEGIYFTRLDDGGRLRFVWSFLEPSQELELRTKFGYVEVLSSEILTDADRIVLVDGTEIIGRILSKEAGFLNVATANQRMRLPQARVQLTARVENVPALELFSKAELYAAELVKIPNAELQEGQVHMGEFCEQILLFDRAVEHYDKALEIGPESPELQFARDRASDKAAVQAELDALSAIEHLKRRKRFDEAMLAIEEFETRYPESPLRPDLYKLRESVLKARDRVLAETIRRRWYFWSSRLARKAAREKSLQEIESWSVESLSEEVLAKVTEDAQKITEEIQPENVRQFWNERDRGRWRTITYGNETWLLGEDAALKEFEEIEDANETDAAPPTELEKTRKQFEEKLRTFLRSQERARRSQSNEDEAAERDRAWLEASSDDRARWTLAYYVENSGDFDLNSKVELRNCRTCGGTGVNEVIYTGSARSGAESGGGADLVRCPTCHGIGRVRRIRYR